MEQAAMVAINFGQQKVKVFSVLARLGSNLYRPIKGDVP